ncbi:MAG: hypothetical protein RJA70_3369 [Pseudomonadota bacterium]|jgi:signal transduction histidine kinase
MALAFVPLYFAISTYTGVALHRAHQENSRALGRTIAAYVAEAEAFRDRERLQELLEAQLGARVAAVGVYDLDGALRVQAALDSAGSWLPRRMAAQHSTSPTTGPTGEQLLAVTVPGPSAVVTVLVRSGEPYAASLDSLVALYISLIAAGLLFGAYFTLTYWIVRPIDQLSRAASLVGSPSRSIEVERERSLVVPSARSREFQDLADNLARMTQTLLSEEQQLRRKIQEVEQATTKLKQAQAHLVRSERLASVGQLAAGLAHEVGNPIAALLGLQDLLLDGGLDEAQQRDFIRRMRKETERINRILRDLLQFARPTTAQQDRVPGAVEAAINETITLVAPQPSLRDVDLKIDVYTDLPQVTLPHEQLMQVLLNLIMNSASACAGRGNITIRAKLIQVPSLRTSAQGETGDRPSLAPLVELSVEDDGPGVAPEFAPRIFEPFVSTKDVGEGTGLGLSVCRGLVEASGGNIQLDERFSNGARFVVQLVPIFAGAR